MNTAALVSALAAGEIPGPVLDHHDRSVQIANHVLRVISENEEIGVCRISCITGLSRNKLSAKYLPWLLSAGLVERREATARPGKPRLYQLKDREQNAKSC